MSEFLNKLISGNEQYCTNMSPELANKKKHLNIEGQKPLVTIITCSDSRISVNDVFGLELGEIFHIRIAGNIINEDILATVEFGILKFQIPSIVVLGHTNCGAIAAKCSGEKASTCNLQSLLEKVELGKKQDLNSQIISNVKNSMEQLKTSALISKRLGEEKLFLAGGIYDLETGKVDFL